MLVLVAGRQLQFAIMVKPNTSANGLPQELVILAGVLIALGAIALGQTLYSFFAGDARNINFMILFLAAGYGLMKQRAYWRLFTMTISVFVLIFKLAPLLIALISWSKPYPQGLPVGSQILFWVVTIAAIGVSGWSLFVLQKPSIVRLFQR